LKINDVLKALELIKEEHGNLHIELLSADFAKRGMITYDILSDIIVADAEDDEDGYCKFIIMR